MCGIIGVLGTQPVAPILIDALKRLEYRGYDSAGIATVDHRGALKRLRAQGKLIKLEEKLQENPIEGNIGIGHTRWATHGAPIESNAHPHMNEYLALVHNGIIENFASLREELISEGYVFTTQTDTEVILHLITKYLKISNAPLEAVQKAIKRLEGAFAIAAIFSNENDLMIAARQGPPLAVGYGKNAMYIGSDAIALAPFTDRISYLEDGDIVQITKENIKFFDRNDQEVKRKESKSLTGSFLVSKGAYRHYMQKEIYEQPEVILRTFEHYIDFQQEKLKDITKSIDWTQISTINFSGCGTAYYATLVAKYWFESLAGLFVDNDVASEFRYRTPPFLKNSLAMFVSQSGETADSLASLRYCKEQAIPTVAIVNVAESSMAREADYSFPTIAGPEIGVASTKAFTCQLAALLSLAIAAGVARGYIDPKKEKEYIKQLCQSGHILQQFLKLDENILKLCREFSATKNMLYLGRGTSYPIALEGALKLKELSYIHAEGYAAGELKHGPIALIDESMPVIVVAPKDKWFDKTVSNIQEVAARGGRIILITDEEQVDSLGVDCMAVLKVPTCNSIFAPIAYALPIQMIAYHTAVLLGTDVDQPRNLAKSVTVE